MANYTMTYKDYLVKYGVLDGLAAFPTITIGDDTYDFTTMFNNRFKFKEIGCETPEYWTEVANRFLGETALIFKDKILGWETKLPSAWTREEIHEERTTDNFYLNPTVAANNTEASPKLQSTSEHVYPHHILYNTETAADLINNALEIRNIFYDCLKHCDNLFISLY